MSHRDPCHDESRDALGAYLLDALDADERAAVEEHLSGCPGCRDELASLQAVVDLLPRAVPQLHPPGSLRDRLMATVHSEAELLRAAGPEADLVSPPRRGWLDRLAPRRLALTLAAAAALAAVGGFVLRDATSGAKRSAAPAAVHVIDAHLASDARAGARASLVIRGGRATLRVARFPRPPRGRVYQVWVVRSEPGYISTGQLFVPNRHGGQSVAVPGKLTGVRQVLVTPEPDSGSQQPTRAPVFTVRL